MIASTLNPRVARSESADRQPQEFHRLALVLVVLLALVNVSAAVLMAGSWATLSTGMIELERTLHDHPAGTID
jgi:hypothetical protein